MAQVLLDHFSILTPGGIVLWSKSFNASLPPFDALVRDKFVDVSEAQSESYETSGHVVRWLLDNSNGLIFAIAYPRILTLPYISSLLQTVRTLFLSLFGDLVQALVRVASGRTSIADVSPNLRKKLLNPAGWTWKGWEETFLDVCREFDTGRGSVDSAAQLKTNLTTPTTLPNGSKVDDKMTKEEAEADMIARNVSAFKSRQRAKKLGRKVLGSANDGAVASGSDATDTETALAAPRPRKEMRSWDNSPSSKEEIAALDFSPSTTPSKQLGGNLLRDALIDQSSLGKVDERGRYAVADFSRQSASDSEAEEEADGIASSATKTSDNSIFGKLARAMGYANQSIREEDLAPVIASIQEQLLAKNVATEVAEAISLSVQESLLGSRQTFGFRSKTLKQSVKKAMHDALTRILTPKSSTDLLLAIQTKINSTTSKAGIDPYVITFVGVNGVGKSTNLSKIAFWLLQNKLRVLIAACDTFRSGAVEQLKVHVNNLSLLSTETRIELYQKGYGKDSASIARDAIAHAKASGYDVVLIDTAGRMQDNEPLMRALAKLITVNMPDKVLFVGEALVGNEAVDQLVKFNTSLRNFTAASTSGRRGIDGIVLTKFDTIDDKVGAAVSMTYVTGKPLLFVGTGQTYSDIRTLSVDTIVSALLA